MLPLQFCHPGPSFPTLLRPAGHPQNDLKFWSVGRLVSWLVCQLVSRSVGQTVTGKSHERHATSSVSSLEPALPDPSMPCGTPPKRPSILVGWSVGQSVMGKSHKRHAASSVLSAGPALPNRSTPCGPPPKRALNFGRSVGRSQASHTNVTLPIQFLHQGPPFPTLLCPAGHPQNDLKFWLVSRLVTGKSQECHAASSVLSPGPALPDPSTPCRTPPKRP
jgi:hypothetical protein